MRARSPLPVLFITVFLDLLGFGLIIPMLGLYAKQLIGEGFLAEHAYLAATMLGAIYSVMQFIFAPLWGKLSDRVGRRPVLLVSIAGSVLGFAAVGLAPSYFGYFGLLFARAFSGIMNANLAVAQAYIADVTKPEDRAKGMAIIGVSFGLGFILGPFVGGELSKSFGFAAPSYVAAALGVLNLFWGFFVLKESLDLSAPPPPRQSRLAALQSIRQDPRLSLLLVLLFVSTFAFANLEQTFALMLEKKFVSKELFGTEDGIKYAASLAGRFLAFGGFLGVILQGGLIGRLVKRYGEGRLCVVGTLLLTIGFFSISFMPTVLTALGAMAVLSIGNSTNVPSMNALISRLSDPARQGELLGVGQSISSLGRIFGPLWGGVAFDHWDYHAPYVTGGVFMLVSFFLALRLAGLLRQGDLSPRAEAQQQN